MQSLQSTRVIEAVLGETAVSLTMPSRRACGEEGGERGPGETKAETGADGRESKAGRSWEKAWERRP